MPDQRRTFGMGRGIRTMSRQTTGRTRVLGVPGGVAKNAADGTMQNLSVPTRPLREADAKTLSSRGRDAVMD